MKLLSFKISYILIAVMNYLWYFYFTKIQLFIIFPILYAILFGIYFIFFKTSDENPTASLGELSGLFIGNLFIIFYAGLAYQNFQYIFSEGLLGYIVVMIQGWMIAKSVIFVVRYLIELKRKEIVGQYSKIDTAFNFTYVALMILFFIISLIIYGFSMIAFYFIFNAMLISIPILLIYLIYVMIRQFNRNKI